MVEAPKQVHGFKVLKSVFFPGDGITRSGHVIIVEKTKGGFVTSWIGVGDRGWNEGHYFEANQKSEAFADFWMRAARAP